MFWKVPGGFIQGKNDAESGNKRVCVPEGNQVKVAFSSFGNVLQSLATKHHLKYFIFVFGSHLNEDTNRMSL